MQLWLLASDKSRLFDILGDSFKVSWPVVDRQSQNTSLARFNKHDMVTTRQFAQGAYFPVDIPCISCRLSTVEEIMHKDVYINRDSFLSTNWLIKRKNPMTTQYYISTGRNTGIVSADLTFRSMIPWHNWNFITKKKCSPGYSESLQGGPLSQAEQKKTENSL